MLNYLKKFRMQINIAIILLIIFEGANFMLLFFSNMSIFRNPSAGISIKTFSDSSIFMTLFAIGLFILMPFALIEGEFRRQDLLDAINNKK